MTLNVCTQERNRDEPKQKIPVVFVFCFLKRFFVSFHTIILFLNF